MTTVAVPSAATTLPPADRAPSPQPFPSAPMSTIAVPASSDIAPAARRSKSNNESPRSSENPSPPHEKQQPHGRTSPKGPPPAIKVKKEPGSPPAPSSRPRPKRLDLSSSSSNARGPQTARPSAPLTSQASAGLAIQDVGLACLSPGFQTNDPSMREQLQRSLDVRDQQRQIIEARQKGAKPGSSTEHDAAGSRMQEPNALGIHARAPATSRRKGPPPGLSIAAPAASQFAEDRVIQSAPLHQTFTGLRPGDHAYSRHAQHGPSGLSQMTHIHHVPASQTNNRLPPISDVFANDHLYVSNQSPSQGPGQAPVPSPGFPPPSHGLGHTAVRGREFRSAEEAVADLSGGREELMPKHVHYGGVQPPTPPSPMPQIGSGQSHNYSGSVMHHPPTLQHHSGHSASTASSRPEPLAPISSRPDIVARTSSTNGRRRGREEYERDNANSPPTSSRPFFAPPQDAKRPAFAVRGDYEHAAPLSQHGFTRESDSRTESAREREDDWRSGMSGTEKKAEFLRLCERAWDLFHT